MHRVKVATDKREQYVQQVRTTPRQIDTCRDRIFIRACIADNEFANYSAYMYLYTRKDRYFE